MIILIVISIIYLDTFRIPSKYSNVECLVSNSKKIKYDYDIQKENSVQVGPWTVYSASKKGTNEEVSVFTFDKKNLSTLLKRGSIDSNLKTNYVLELLRKDVSSLSRLRHPSLLQVVEPLEESKSSMSFVTRRIQSMLQDFIKSSNGGFSNYGSSANGKSSGNALEEVEIQKGLLQIIDGLVFLHGSAKVIHYNIRPSSVVVDAKGDWKLCGFSFSQSVESARYEFNDYDFGIPSSLQQSMDFLAPEYITHEIAGPESDVFSFGCLIYSIFNKNQSIINANNHLLSYEKEITSLNSPTFIESKNLPSENLKSLLKETLAVDPKQRASMFELERSPYFTGSAIAALRFLESFPEKLPSEKVSFMESLSKNLTTFPYRIQSQKILPTLLDHLNDQKLVPSLLPCIFEISKGLDSSIFSSKVFTAIFPIISAANSYPERVPLCIFQYMDCLKSKLPSGEFLSKIVPFIYGCFENSSLNVQTTSIQILGTLLDIIDVTTVKSSICPKLYHSFSVTNQLDVKVAILDTFNVFINQKFLDSFAIVDKLLPVLEKVKTREPTVVMGMVTVYISAGAIIPEETVHEQVIPRLWILSVSPSLSLEQYNKCMREIRSLSDAVQKSHAKKLQSKPSSVVPNRITTDPFSSQTKEATSKPSSISPNKATTNIFTSQASLSSQGVARETSSASSYRSYSQRASTPAVTAKSSFHYATPTSGLSNFNSVTPSSSASLYPPLIPSEARTPSVQPANRRVTTPVVNQNTVTSDSSNDLGGWKSLL